MHTVDQYVLIWEANNKRREAIIPEGEHFLGRLAEADAKALKIDHDPYQIYFYSLSKKFCKPTDLFYFTVSRRHLKMFLERNKLYIMDYGISGHGTRNGTLLNNIKIKSGEKIPVEKGDSIRLSPSGPLFTIGVKKKEYIELNVTPGVPIELHPSIGRDVLNKGLALESAESHGVLVIVLKDFNKPINLEGVRLIPNIVSEKERHRETLRRMYGILLNSENLLLQRKYYEALDMVKKLMLDKYEESIKSIGDKTLYSRYYRLKQLLKHEKEPPEDILRACIKELYALLEEY